MEQKQNIRIHVEGSTFTNVTQCVERILNKTAKAINETFTGLKLMLQGFRIHFV